MTSDALDPLAQEGQGRETTSQHDEIYSDVITRASLSITALEMYHSRKRMQDSDSISVKAGHRKQRGM